MQLFRALLLFAASATLVTASADYGSEGLFARDAEADFGDDHGLASALNARDAAAEAEADIDGEHMSLLRRESAAALNALSTLHTLQRRLQCDLYACETDHDCYAYGCKKCRGNRTRRRCG